MPSDGDQKAIRELLDFWFDEATRPRWYDSTPAFDELCRQRYGDLAARAAQGELAGWEQTAEGALALCLLLDQMPRNLFRATPQAFGADDKAVAAAARALGRGFDRALDPDRRTFLYMPFMHSERLADQERSVALAAALDDGETLPYAEEHADIIRRFGRFPHRNAILGRESTPEEAAFLAAGARSFGQTAKSDG
ncbi:MAG: DUF924 domain-containing protein [Rhizobiales bacterium]|nr:DUF924 domain-containing protein [Hyphomicrobiales bacterium]